MEPVTWVLGFAGSFAIGELVSFVWEKGKEKMTGGRINALLEQYFEPLDSADLGSSLMTGEVTASNLVIKPGALAELGLPLSVVAGHVGSFKMEVNWKDIKKKPITIELDDVCVVVAVGDVKEKPDPQEPDGVMSKMKKDFAKQIRQKVHFTMTDVHVRLESSVTSGSGGGGDAERSGEGTFALGFTIGSLGIDVTKDKDTPQFTKYKFSLGRVGADTDATTGSDSSSSSDDSSGSSSSDEDDDDDDSDDGKNDNGISDGMRGFALYCSPGTKPAGQPMMKSLKNGMYQLPVSTQRLMVDMIGSKDLDYIIRPIHLVINYTKDNSEGMSYDYDEDDLTDTDEEGEGPSGVSIKYMRVPEKSAKEVGPHDDKFDTLVRAREFSDESYRYEPQHEVKVEADELRLSSIPSHCATLWR